MRRAILGATAAGLLQVTIGVSAQQQPMGTFAVTRDSRALAGVDRMVSQMARSGDLVLQRTERDPLLAGLEHQRYHQRHLGVPVWGATVVRQLTTQGEAVSVFGSLQAPDAIVASARITSDAATAAVERAAGIRLGTSRKATLVWAPVAGGHCLCYTTRAFGTDARMMRYFVDAQTGAIVRTLDETKHQAAVGTGRGVLGDQKKVSTEAVSAGFMTHDLHRPPVLSTFDMRGDTMAVIDVLNGNRALLRSDFAVDADNDWNDGAVVDAHAYAGWTYDYFFKRHNRRGLDNADSPILSIVNPVRREDLQQQPDEIVGAFYLNAGYYGDGLMIYGVGLPANYVLSTGQRVNQFPAALDIVAHELTHGVTDFSSGLVYEGESGALNEAFSDIMGTAAEFFHQPRGTGLREADYLMGEDVFTPGGIRALSNPSAKGDPDHYSARYVGSGDNGGVHINSGIVNHAYFLAIEGGTHRTSRLTVAGVGNANREQMEKIFYRAFVFMLPSTASFSTARAATIQAARDLYGDGSAAARAVTEAWNAVGVF
jgi:bacillolysin